jgi:hypothetical protein
MDFDPDDAKVQALQGQRDRMMGFGPCPWCETKRRPSGRRKGCARGVRGAWRMRGPARSSRGRAGAGSSRATPDDAYAARWRRLSAARSRASTFCRRTSAASR